MKRSQRGNSLVELIVVLTMLGAIWMTIVLALHSLYRADRRLRDELDQTNAMDRFIVQLRLDSHEAISATIAADSDPALTLSQGESRSVQYRTSDDGIERVVRAGETIEHRDSYRLPEIVRVAWKKPESNPRLVNLTLEVTNGRKTAIRKHEISAALQIVPQRERRVEEDRQ